MRLIDVMHLGHERVIGCWQVGDVLVDPGPTSCLPTLLDALGDQRPRALLLTHIHLDHAGASGALVERWPDLEVYVHERGAPHMVEPGRLLKSARRLYGADMDRLWGDMTPVPERNLRVLAGGEMLLDGPSRSPTRLDTPRTTSPTCTTEPRSSATSEACGSRPPRWWSHPRPRRTSTSRRGTSRSTRIAAWRPRRLAVTHFGASEDVEAQLEQVGRRLDAWGDRARSRDRAEFIAAIEAEIAAGTEPEWTEAFTQAAPPDQLYAGLDAVLAKTSRGPSTGKQSAGILSSMSQTVELPRVGGPGSGVGGLWRVVVLNDDFNTFDHVAETLASVIPGINLADGLPVSRPDPQHGMRDRLERPARGRRGLLGAPRLRRPDDGAARVGLGRRRAAGELSLHHEVGPDVG